MLKIIELFAGIGSQTQALKNIGVDHEVVAICEIDKYAVKSYEAIHGAVNNLGDITKAESLPDADLWTYSFPCTDLSMSGNQKGMGRNSGTRSGLLWEVERLLKASTLPKYLLLENVKPLVGEKFADGFAEWRKSLQDMGYRNYYQVLNAKDYGVPQSRERVFMVSILGEGEPFSFPEKEPLTKRLKDILQSEVEEKYYLTPEKIKDFEFRGWRWGEPKINIVATIKDPLEHHGRLYDINGIAPTLCTMTGGGQQPKIITIGRGMLDAGVSDLCPSITISSWSANNFYVNNFEIRKLVPIEFWRLFGFTDEAFHKSEAVNSNSQLYKQAGNSIVVDVLERIFRSLLLEDKGNIQDTQMEFL